MKLAAIFLALLLGLGGIGYWYYNDTQQRLATLQQNNAKLETAVQVSEASVTMLRDDMVKNQKLNEELQQELQKAEKYGDELRATLQKHNLTALALSKPGLIEKRMNDATKKLWADITSDTTPAGVRDTGQDVSGTKSNNSN